MWNEPGGKEPTALELDRILKRHSGPIRKILRYQNSGSTATGYIPIDPDLKRVCENVLKRIPRSTTYDREYTPEQGRIVRKRKDSRDFVIEDMSRVYAIYKNRGITHLGRKAIKDNLILSLLVLLSYSKYPEIHQGIMQSLTAEERAALFETLEYILGRYDPECVQHRIEEETRYAYDRGAFFASLRDDCSEKKDISVLKNIGSIPQRQMEVIDKVVNSWEKKEGKIPFNAGIFIAALIYVVREWERKTGVKIFKQNTELSEIWGIPLRTLERYLKDLRELEQRYPEPLPVSNCSPISPFSFRDMEK